MSVLMVGIGGLVGYPNREQCNDGGNQIERGVSCFGEDSQATGCNAYHHFENSNGHRSQHGVARDRTLFLAHGPRAVDGRRYRHIVIISVGWFAAKLHLWARSHFPTSDSSSEVCCQPRLAPLSVLGFLTSLNLSGGIIMVCRGAVCLLLGAL